MKTYKIFLFLFSVIFIVASCTTMEPEDNTLVRDLHQSFTSKPDINQGTNSIQNGTIVTDLNNIAINSIAFDNSNTMWVGTNEGLYKAVTGGYQNIYFNATTQINTLKYEASANTLWIGTNNGLSKLTNVGNTSEAIENIAVSNLSSNIINSIYVDSISAKWFGGYIGLSRNYNNSWQKANYKKWLSGDVSAALYEEYGINSIAAFNGDYYFATSGNYIWKCSNWDATVDAFSGATSWDPMYNGSAISDTMNVVFVDSKYRQWMAGNNGIQVHTGHDSKSNITTYITELPNLRVHAIAEAPNGNIWVGTENGLTIFNGSSWATQTTLSQSNYITAIAFESTKNAWIGTKKGLISFKLNTDLDRVSSRH